jgi:hypothetical protein
MTAGDAANAAPASLCDCDLNLDPHRPNHDHYRACGARYEGHGLTLTCRVIRGHKGEHWTVFTREAKWSEGEAVFYALRDESAP